MAVNLTSLIAMSYFLILLLFFVTVDSAPKLQAPCGRDNNVKKCLCQNGKTYYQTEDGNIDRRCPDDTNPVQSCTCTDGSVWESPTTRGPPRPDTTQAPPSSNQCESEEITPCNNYENVRECTCNNGRTYKGRQAIRRNCKKSTNPISICICTDGSSWDPIPWYDDNNEGSDKGESEQEINPCGGSDFIDECTCKDGKTYADPKEIKCKCGKTKNPIELCKCTDGFTWDPLPLYDY